MNRNETRRRLVDRVCVLVCDGLGVGGAPDAAEYGDSGADTLGHIAEAVGGLILPNLERLGLGFLTHTKGVAAQADSHTAHGRQTERSAGKDSTTGHWEMMGIVLDRPFPTYPGGFPEDVIGRFEDAIGRQTLGNRAASGTEIIAELGEEHLRTGKPIVYTSADSVLQIATHAQVVPLAVLYEWCEVARAIMTGEHAVGRVIARPFRGPAGAFVRMPDRRDFSVAPPGPTVLDYAAAAGVRVCGVGKIRDIFDGRGLTDYEYSRSNEQGLDLTIAHLKEEPPVLVFTNLVDFDSKYGHRSDAVGYARALEALDGRIPEIEAAVAVGQGDSLLFVTGDHGCDPTDVSTDHTRERAPVLVSGIPAEHAVDLGDRSSFGDLGATVADVLGIGAPGLEGASFAGRLGYWSGAR